ncbi:MAG TPA: 2-dehydropantoate 2-reductase [Polyangiaceae bacterium]|jgi:2-dehydropantoate 2-reductase|nr:2-dehydropantoate 2-reductase [Polyangiaceae bacterium]
MTSTTGAGPAHHETLLRPAPNAGSERVLVVGAGPIGAVLASAMLATGHRVVTLTTNTAIARALREHGFRLSGNTVHTHVAAGDVVAELATDGDPFDVVFLATQPTQVEDAARTVLPALALHATVVCLQNGLCEDRVARIVGRPRVVGAVVAWGASMTEPGRYDRTSQGGFTVGPLDGSASAHGADRVAELLAAVGPVARTTNLIGARFSKLAINCAISTLGTIGGNRVGALLKYAFVRRLALEIMSEAAFAARAEGVRLEKVAGTIDLDWLALSRDDADRGGRGRAGLVARHAVLVAAGFRYRRLRSSMLAAIERGRPPAVDFLNGEIVERGVRHGIATPINRAARDVVWQIARGERQPSLATLRDLFDTTR